jgi:hypothetical protein
VTAMALQVFQRIAPAITPSTLERMVKAADKDGDGEISYQEFIEAFHSPQWREARALGMSQAKFGAFRETQDAMCLPASQPRSQPLSQPLSGLSSQPSPSSPGIRSNWPRSG